MLLLVQTALPGGVDVLLGGHQTPIQGPLALRWRFSHRADQSPLRGRKPQKINTACDLSTPINLSAIGVNRLRKTIHTISLVFSR